MENKIKVFIENTNENVLVSQGMPLLDGLLEAKVKINHSCGGSGSCGTCRIKITSDITILPARNFIESEMAKDRKFSDDERLACQLEPMTDISINIP
jgi:ferredoxin, 2Fe-2S